jgi:sulfotransferase family protein
MSNIHRIAMWSGPRNISTAMMRSWGNRPDTVVCDEPLYGYYLNTTGIDHPGREEVLASHGTDWRIAVDGLLAPLPPDKSIFYQKHMTHHLLPEVDRAWLDGLRNCFLIRDPREVLLSYSKVIAAPRLEDLGLPQQVELFHREWKRTKRVPPVLDAKDVLVNPAGMLKRLCDELGIIFDDRQLHWPPGPRPTDGVWAKYWYAAVEKSTGFEPCRPRTQPLPGHLEPARGLEPLLASCRPYYNELHAHRLTATPV